jgi:integrase/recombinase XerD
MNGFYKFSPVKSLQDMMNTPNDVLENYIIEYLDHLKNRVANKDLSANSVATYMKPIKKILVANGKENAIRWKQIESMYPNLVRRSGYRAWSKDDIAKMLKHAKTSRNRALILFLASNGGRRGIFDHATLGHELLMKHLVPMEYRGLKMYAVLLYAEEGLTVEEMEERESGEAVQGSEYWSFLTPEATDALDEYFEWLKRRGVLIDDDSPVFCALKPNKKFSGDEKTLFDQVPLTSDSVYQCIARIVKNAEIPRIKKGTRFNTQMVHGFRKFTNGALKMTDNMNYQIAEKIMAHKTNLDSTYLKPTRQECWKEFIKAIPDLTINEGLKKSIELDKLDEENEKLKLQAVENRKIKSKVIELEEEVLEMKSKSTSQTALMIAELLKNPETRKMLTEELLQNNYVTK